MRGSHGSFGIGILAVYRFPQGEHSSLIEALLDSLPTLFAENQVIEAALGGPIGAALAALVRSSSQFLCLAIRSYV
jgi:hypothetical protein